MNKKKPTRATTKKKSKVSRKNLKDLNSKAPVKGGVARRWIDAPGF
jgi:hypothetical protein